MSTFIPTAQWQAVRDGQTIPPGLWVRMDLESGTQMARTMPSPEERAIDEQQQKERKRQQQAEQNERNKQARLLREQEAVEALDPEVIRQKREADEARDAIRTVEIAARQKELAAKEAERQKVLDAAAAAKEVQKRAREAEAAAAAEAEAEAERKEEEAKKQLRESQKQLRATFGKACKTAGLDLIHSDYLRAQLKAEELQVMVDAFSVDSNSPAAKALFAQHLASLLAVEKAAADARAEKEAAAAAVKKQKDLEANWTPEEIAMLAKALAKYPPGVGLRWHKITDMINTVSPVQRVLDDVLKRAKPLENAAASIPIGTKRIDEQAAFQTYKEKMQGQNGGSAASEAASAASASPADLQSSPSPSPSSSSSPPPWDPLESTCRHASLSIL